MICGTRYNFMTLKSKITLILLCVFILYGILGFAIQHFIIMPSFLELEREEAIKDVKRSVEAVQGEIHLVDFICRDWASWDDTYKFIESRSDEYIKANLTLSAFTVNKINAIYYVDVNGKIIWGEIHDLEPEKTIQLPEIPKYTFPANHPLVSHKMENKSPVDVKVTGIYMTAKGPMLIASRPILTSNNEGPIRGSLIFGRFLTDKIIKTLVDQIQVDFQIFPRMAESLPESVKDIPNRISDESGYIIEVSSHDHVDSYTTFPDINGDTAFLIKSKTSRKISDKGYATMRYAGYSILAAGMGVLIVMLLLLHFSVLGPITDFTNRVISIGKTGDLSASVSIQRRDEIGILACEFDRMLEQLQKSRAELELKVKERTAELTITNDMLCLEMKERKLAEEEAREVEEKLARSKRMESLGLMAGGIAHDLNNILSGIVTIPDLLLMDLPEGNPLRKPIGVMKGCGQRAADVVSELLTVARGVAAVKDVINLNTLIEEFISSAEYKQIKSLNPSTTLVTQLDPDMLNISCSTVHIKKCLLNLVVNAFESIEDSGNIIITTRNCYLDEPLAGYEDVRKGEYVMLIISDNGSGIFGSVLMKKDIVSI